MSARARPHSGSRPASSSGSASARPFSSTNLSATVASSRFKTFAVQYDILCKNAILCELAKEIPWKNLLELFTLKFYPVGDVLWRHGDHPTELAFVLCGGFLARHMQPEITNNSSTKTAYTTTPNTATVEPTESIVAEKLLTPGASIALFAVDNTQPIRYSVVTAKFKSILIALPLGKYKSVMRQLTPSTKAMVQQLIVDHETKLCGAIKLPLPRRIGAIINNINSCSRATTAPTPGRSPLKRAISTPTLLSALTNTKDPHTNNGVVHTASWDSLQVAQPAEYAVNSALLILHASKSAATLYMPSTVHSASHQMQTKLQRGSSTSSVVRAIAKKHTTRRLASIKLPATVDAFPPPPKRWDDIQAEALAAASSISASHGLDVVSKVRIGRLLAPIKKPTVVGGANDTNKWRVGANASLVGHPILLADRIEQFRDEDAVN